MERTQNDLILDYLDSHVNGITPQDAIAEFGCLRLSARIHDLRDKGYEISTTSETRNNRYGHPCTYARYKLVKGAK